jgi:hypothetical protein
VIKGMSYLDMACSDHDNMIYIKKPYVVCVTGLVL